MNILLANTRHYHGGGDSTYTFNLSNLLLNMGNQVSFFAMKDERNILDINSDLFVTHVDFRLLNKKKNLVNGIKVLMRSIFSFEAKEKFGIMLDRVQPDIVHLQNIHAHITPSVIFEAKKRGIPVVWTLHDYKLVCPNSHFIIDKTNQICEACHGRNFIQAVRHRCKKGSLFASSIASLESYAHRWLNVLSKVDAFLCPSVFLREKLVENGFCPEKVHHVPLFLPDTQFVQQQQDQGYLLFLGKLEPLKGIFPLIEAARCVPEMRLVLAGRVEEPIKNMLPGLLPSNVEYVGLKSGMDLETLRQNAIALVVPSIWYENQPFSILEAFSSTKPVIASAIGGMKELVEPGIRGLLVDPGNVDQLADAMRFMINHREEMEKMGVNAKKYAMTYHSAEAHYQKLSNIYQRFL